MQTSRIATRAQRALRAQAPMIRRQVRFASDGNAQAAKAGTSAVTGGIIGGSAVLAVSYAYYHFSSAKSAVEAAKQAKGYADSLAGTLKVKFEEKTPEANQAIETLKQSAQQYASFVSILMCKGLIVSETLANPLSLHYVGTGRTRVRGFRVSRY